jgi:hypothetical protein
MSHVVVVMSDSMLLCTCYVFFYACSFGVFSSASCVVALSEARIGLTRAKKVQDTPFPFAYAQLCFLMLHMFMVIVPWVCSRYIGGHIMSATVSAASVWIYFCVNATAAEYEQPFGRQNSKGSGEWSQGRLPLKQVLMRTGVTFPLVN